MPSKKMTDAKDDAMDKKKGIAENSAKDKALDKKRGVPESTFGNETEHLRPGTKTARRKG